jgi:hypothetical protein
MDVGKFVGKEPANQEKTLRSKRWISAYSRRRRDEPLETQEKKLRKARR